MKVVQDRSAAVTISATGDVAKRGEPVDVPDDIGTQLLEQGWREAGREKSARTEAVPTPVEKEKV